MSMCAGACDVIMIKFSMSFSHVPKFQTRELGVGGSADLEIKNSGFSVAVSHRMKNDVFV